MADAAPAFSVPAPLMCEQRGEEALLAEVFEGLAQSPKRISPVWMHDERGAALYDRLCAVPEYYLARAELALVDARAASIAASIGPRAALIEFGSGTSLKARVLLDELESPVAYVPVDVARTPLIAVSRNVAARFPDLAVLPVCADFTRSFVLPAPVQDIERRIVYLSGATLGNFARAEAVELLRFMHRVVGPLGAVLIGLDFAKEPAVIERAYNDRAGVMGELNRNALRHLNHRFGADFDVRRFIHRAVWVDEASRIEMRLVSSCDQLVTIGDRRVPFAKGEHAITEYGHKYPPQSFESLAREADLAVREGWVDEQWSFGLELLEPASGESARRWLNPAGQMLLPAHSGTAPAF